MKPLLSICIPTYNRGPLLKETMENVMDEVSKVSADYRDLIEICVSDNASTDNTPSIVDELRGNCEIPVSYRRNEKNEGPDINFLNVVEMANGEFVWLMSSDDKIEEGGIAFICKFITEHPEIDILLLAFREFDSYMRVEKKRRKNKKPKLDILFFDSPLNSSLDVIHDSGLISQLCFRKNSWDAIKDYEHYIGFQYIHTYKILRMIKDGAKAVHILNPPLVRYRSFNDSILKEFGWYKREMFALDFSYIIPKAVYGENSREHLELSGKLIKKMYPPLLVSTTVMKFDLRHRLTYIRKFINYYKGFKYFLFVIFPFLFNPLGSNGKILFLFPMEKILEQFH